MTGPFDYSLQLQVLRAMAQEVLSRADEGRLRGVAGDLDLQAYDRKILRDYVIDGRLTQIPTQRKKREVIAPLTTAAATCRPTLSPAGAIRSGRSTK